MHHILVCDDEEDIVAALKIYLESDWLLRPHRLLRRGRAQDREGGASAAGAS